MIEPRVIALMRVVQCEKVRAGPEGIGHQGNSRYVTVVEIRGRTRAAGPCGR